MEPCKQPLEVNTSSTTMALLNHPLGRCNMIFLHLLLLLLLVLPLMFSVVATNKCVIEPTRFRTNALINPLALADDKPRFSYALALKDSIKEPLGTNHFQTAYRIRCTDALTGEILWDSTKIYSNQTLEIEYAGKQMGSLVRVTWQVQVWDENGNICESSKNDSRPYFETGLLQESAWDGAQWIARYGKLSPNATLCSLMAESEENKSPRFRTVVELPNPQHPGEDFVQFRAYIVGLGYYQLYINGQRVGYALLDPAWTTYSKRVLYAAYDVSDLILSGRNQSRNHSFAVGVELGNGEWNPLPMLFWGRRNIRYHLVNQQGHPSTRPMFRFIMVGFRADGTTVSLLKSNTATWRAGGSPTLFNNLYLGEKYDARLEDCFDGWSSIHYGEAPEGNWAKPVLADASGLGILEAQSIPPIRKQRTLQTTPLSMRQNADGKNQIVLLDTGLNHAGSCRIRIQPATNRAGSLIQFRYGECLDENGKLNPLTSVAGGIYERNPNVPCQPDIAYQQDLVILGSHGVDWTPSWSWHGFRYIEATIPQDLDPDDLYMECFTMRTDVDVISNFTSSDPWLSQLREMVQNTFESNLMGIQTGCSHRERFGYGGDALASGEAAMSIYDFSAFYRKRVLDYNDGQRMDSIARKFKGFTETSPFVGIADGGLGFDTGPIGWQLFQLEAQLWLYKYYGDLQTMKDSIVNSAAFIDFLDSGPDGIEKGLGDWQPVYGTDVRFTGRGFQRMAYLDYANITDLIGLPTSIAERFRQKASDLAKMLNKRFQDGSGAFLVGKRSEKMTQTGQGMALFNNFVNEDVRQRALQYLVGVIQNSTYVEGACHSTSFKTICPKAKGGPGPHLTAGMFGIKWVLMALADGGENDLAYDIVATDSYPGFRWMTANPFSNATTLWESYYFSDHLSMNHPMFGSAIVWLFQSVAGIQPDPSSRGMSRILIRPNPPSQLHSAAASFETLRGIIKVSWKQKTGVYFSLKVFVPPNCRAIVHMPSTKSGTMLFHNGVITVGRWIPSLKSPVSGSEAFDIGSGKHDFKAIYKVQQNLKTYRILKSG